MVKSAVSGAKEIKLKAGHRVCHRGVWQREKTAGEHISPWTQEMVNSKPQLQTADTRKLPPFVSYIRENRQTGRQSLSTQGHVDSVK